MKRRERNGASAPMTHDAYAGFLKLLLTPGSRLPEGDADVDAYVRHANRLDPLSPQSRRALGHPTNRAA
jgi:hypothetical protein